MPEDPANGAFGVEIPDRLFFKIGDVSRIAGVETHVLRFWENEFPMLSPRKAPNGQRQYRRKDVEAVLAIKQLLHVEGYTIAGARKALRSKGLRGGGEAPAEEPVPAARDAAVSATALREIRAELERILEMLKP